MSARRIAAAVLLSTAGLGLWATPAFGQEATARPLSPGSNEVTADRFGLIDGEQLQIETGTDNDELTFRAALPTGPGLANRFSLAVSTPLHGGDDAMPASLDALANGTRVTLSVGWFGLGTPRDDPRAVTIAAAAKEKCLGALNHGDCDEPNYAVRAHLTEQYREYLSYLIPRGALDLGLDATVGINEFEWVDPATLGRRQERHTDWGVSAHLSHYRPGTAFTFSVSYKSAFEAAPEQLLCPANPVDPATQCITARGAAPARNEHFLISAGMRHRFLQANGALARLAVAPLITYDVQDDVFGVDVPVYLIPGADGGLTGGVRFGYRSDRDDEFTIGIFFGAAFSIL